MVWFLVCEIAPAHEMFSPLPLLLAALLPQRELRESNPALAVEAAPLTRLIAGCPFSNPGELIADQLLSPSSTRLSRMTPTCA